PSTPKNRTPIQNQPKDSLVKQEVDQDVKQIPTLVQRPGTLAMPAITKPPSNHRFKNCKKSLDSNQNEIQPLLVSFRDDFLASKIPVETLVRRYAQNPLILQAIQVSLCGIVFISSNGKIHQEKPIPIKKTFQSFWNHQFIIS